MLSFSRLSVSTLNSLTTDSRALSRVHAAVEEAGISRSHPVHAIHSNIWRVTTDERDFAIKLFDGANSGQRLKTEFAVCTHLAKTGAPVPTAIVKSVASNALVRSWIPGQTLHQRLLKETPLSPHDASTVHSAWTAIIHALKPWHEHFPQSRLRTAHELRRRELEMVATAIIDAYPSIPPSNVEKLVANAMACGLSTLPLDASPSNIILGPNGATFIDLEIIGFDFPCWTFAKYVTTTTRSERSAFAPSLITALPDETSGLQHFDAALTVLVLLASSGAWNNPTMTREEILANLPCRSDANDHIRAVLT